ncbi:MAG: hypothetical protein QY321_01890 [Patescibacteria group bacterium]|nr:MAG: hypothetical protein QY321_01890 [Patescibacteria group bacterium]
MKKTKNLFSYLLLFVVGIITAAGCDNSVTSTETKLELDYMYIAMGIGDGGYYAPAMFYFSNNSIGSTLPPIAQIKGWQSHLTDQNKVTFHFNYFDQALWLDAIKTPFKWMDTPPRSSAKPYNGVGVVRDIELIWRYDTDRGTIEIIKNGSYQELDATYDPHSNSVFIAGGKKLKPYIFQPINPMLINMYYWEEDSIEYESHRIQ